MNDTSYRVETEKLIESIAKEIAGDIDATLFTSTASVEAAKPFTAKDLWKAKLSMLGLEIKENPLMPDNCIALIPKDSKHVAWFNIDTKKAYVLDTKKILEDMACPTIR